MCLFVGDIKKLFPDGMQIQSSHFGLIKSKFKEATAEKMKPCKANLSPKNLEVLVEYPILVLTI